MWKRATHLTLGELQFLQPHNVAVLEGEDLHSLVVQQALEGLDQLQVRCGRDIVPPPHCLVIPVIVGKKNTAKSLQRILVMR